MQMTRLGVRRAATLLVPGLVALGAAACGSSTPKASSTGAGGGNKTAFCRANIAIDQAGNSATTMDGFLAVLKSHSADLATLKNDGPPSIRAQAQTLVATAEKAIADNNPNELETSAASDAGAAVDTFCGVDGSGKALPSYFGAGKGQAICAVNNQINQGTTTATSADQVLAFLSAHQDLVNQFDTDLASLPAAQKAEAQQLVTTARTAIASKDATALGSQATLQASADIGLYCGQNQ